MSPLREKNADKYILIAICVLLCVILSVCCAPAAFAEGNSGVTYMTLEEYAEQYPLQAADWMKEKEDDGICMAPTSMQRHWTNICAMAFGMDGIPVACGTCHMSNIGQALDEYGTDIFMMTDTQLKEKTGFEAEYMGCGVCHDPADMSKVTPNTTGTSYFATDPNSKFPERDATCGQCHSAFDGQIFAVRDDLKIDIYKYGTDADSVLKAMRESWETYPQELTAEEMALGYNVGFPMYDEAIDAVLFGYSTENTAVETFQGSMHQKMGLSCVDCHMPQTTDEASGVTYTSHSPSFSPLENEDALNYCLTCHQALSKIATTDEMVTFVQGKMTELGARQAEVHAELNELYAALAEATTNGNVEEATLEAARNAYVTANFYWNFEKGTAQHEDVGNEAAHNFKGSTELLDKAEALVLPAIESLK